MAQSQPSTNVAETASPVKLPRLLSGHHAVHHREADLSRRQASKTNSWTTKSADLSLLRGSHRSSSKEHAGTHSSPLRTSMLERLRIVVSNRCNNLSDWKKHYQCHQDRRVFICAGGYPDFRQAMLNRGWYQNPDKTSPHFDLKWGMVSNIDFPNLQPHQIVNHFDRCRDLTTKVGLTLSLRSSPWHGGPHPDEYYPRAYDFSDPLERNDFILDFKFSKAEAVLHRFLEHVDGKAEVTFSEDVVHMCWKICLRQVTDIDDMLDCSELADRLSNISASEWDVLQQVNLDNASVAVAKVDTADWTVLPFSRQVSKHTEHDKDKDQSGKKHKGTGRRKKKQKPEEMELFGPLSAFDTVRGQYYIKQARSVLQELEESPGQHRINGSRNAWIVKPSGKSRGRGIQMMRELSEIFKVAETDGFQWICQKYIEQPQLIHGYKFDIRQWVLVTDWNPLTIYIWKHPYFRFAGKKYDGSLEDRNGFMHLVNNSIIKHMAGFDSKNDELNAFGYMWFRQQYEEWLHNKYCPHERHFTPWLRPPPYTCETFGVKWEEVAFTADEDEEDCGDEHVDESYEALARPSPRSRTLGALEELPLVPPSSASCSSCSGQLSARSGKGKLTSPRMVQSTDALHELPTVLPQVAATPRLAPPRSADGRRPSEASRTSSEAEGECQPCENMWDTVIVPQIKDIVLHSLRCVTGSVEQRKNSAELYGYDFMISEDRDHRPKVWLIEVNSSPACDYSTPVTCPLVKQMMEDSAKVLVDLRDNPNASTGEWELMEHDESHRVIVQRKLCPVSLEVRGTPIRNPKGH
mmetsp:Transcript_21877/g.49886  ORF Transcript_21877/g.49886 Transcript_21877/m.49886 type:complete len:804 (-) Transcript_21877:18-2429(-)